MNIYSQQTILLAIIGSVGLLSTLTVLITAFKRNRLAKNNFQ